MSAGEKRQYGNFRRPMTADSGTITATACGDLHNFDAQGKVTGAILEQQGPQGPTRMQLERK